MKETTRVSAYGLITDGTGRLLLCRLSSIVEHLAGQWTLPGGGVDFGEDPAVAVVREVREETGLTARVEKLLDVDSAVIEFSDKIVHAIRIIYQATVDPGELKVEAEGSTDACDWFYQDHLKHLPLVSLSRKGLKLLGWDGSDSAMTNFDLSLTGLMQHYERIDDPRSRMTLDYLQEIHDIHTRHSDSARRRLTEMNKYRRR